MTEPAWRRIFAKVGPTLVGVEGRAPRLIARLARSVLVARER